MTNSVKHSTGTHAIVVGASIAGLLAGRVLAEHFAQVTIIDRDTLPHGPEFRKGVPQAHHTHVLMMRGQQILERLFPGFEKALDQHNVPEMHWLTDVQLCYGGWVPQFDLGIVTRNSTRPTLEWIVRSFLMAYPNVQFIENCQVDGLVMDTHEHVTGVNVSYRRNSDQRENGAETINADLVVDASGRSSHAPEWLTACGYAAPEQTFVNAFLGYSSRLYKSLSKPVPWKLLGMNPKPPNRPEGGSITLQEDGKWIVTLAGFARHHPPTDEAGFLAFARDLAEPHIYDAIKEAEPVSEIFGYQNTQNCLHHYERLARMPKRFVIMGDAMCSLNPIYGHGMTVSAMSAEVLEQFLQAKHDLDTLGAAMQKKLAKIVGIPWLMATGADFQYPETEGKRPGGVTQLAQAYLERLIGQMALNPDVARSFIEVMNLVKPPTSLFHPRLVMTVLQSSGPRTPLPSVVSAASES